MIFFCINLCLQAYKKKRHLSLSNINNGLSSGSHGPGSAALRGKKDKSSSSNGPSFILHSPFQAVNWTFRVNGCQHRSSPQHLTEAALKRLMDTARTASSLSICISLYNWLKLFKSSLANSTFTSYFFLWHFEIISSLPSQPHCYCGDV
jgi:hypothetical protein